MTTAPPDTLIAQPRPKVTVSYDRSVQVRPYETAKASIFVSADIVGTWNTDGLFVPEEGAVKEAALCAFFEAKVAVLDQLALPYTVLENIVIENIDAKLGPVDVHNGHPAQGTTTPVSSAPPASPTGGGDWKTNPPADKAGLVAELMANPTRFFDNRVGKRNPKAPDYKRMHTGEGIWLDKASAEVKAWAAAN